MAGNDLYTTWVFGDAIQGISTTTAPNTVTVSTAGNWYPQGTMQANQTASEVQMQELEALGRMQQEWQEQQRLYEQQMDAWRSFYMYGQGTFRQPEPEKLATKELSALDRERLLAVMPF